MMLGTSIGDPTRRLIKVCGLTTPEAVAAALAVGVDVLGMVAFEQSPRHLSPDAMAALRARMPASTKTALVTANMDDDALATYIAAARPTIVQLHGGESDARAGAVRARYPDLAIIRAISAARRDAAGDAFADALLVEAPTPAAERPGGWGQAWDWGALENWHPDKPWLLAGGLTPDNVAEAMAVSGAQWVDASTGLESAPGVKDPLLVRAFVRAARQGQAVAV